MNRFILGFSCAITGVMTGMFTWFFIQINFDPAHGVRLIEPNVVIRTIELYLFGALTVAFIVIAIVSWTKAIRGGK